jgi:hypothetical protein
MELAPATRASQTHHVRAESVGAQDADKAAQMAFVSKIVVRFIVSSSHAVHTSALTRDATCPVLHPLCVKEVLIGSSVQFLAFQMGKQVVAN